MNRIKHRIKLSKPVNIVPNLRKQVDAKIKERFVPVEVVNEVQEQRYSVVYLTSFLLALSVLGDVVMANLNISAVWKMIFKSRTVFKHIRLVYDAVIRIIQAFPKALKEAFELNEYEKRQVRELVSQVFKRISTEEIEGFEPFE